MPITYSQVFTKWMDSTTLAIMNEARRLVNGPLLKVASGSLLNSFYRRILQNGHLGIVGNRAKHAYLWEYEGLGGPKKAPKGRPFKIVKRGVLSPRSQKGVIYRNYIKPKSKYKKPVEFLWTATKNEMTGRKGVRKLQDLGYGVGWAISIRYVQMLKRTYSNLTIRVI